MIVHTQQLESSESLFTSGPNLRGPLPPAERDFQVFERVVVEGATTREAAKEFGLSQTRIMQIRTRVAEWIGSEVPETERLTPRQQIRLAATLARQRIDYLYSQAMQAWRSSMGEQTTRRSGGYGGDSEVTRESHGDVKYLAMASRIAGLAVPLASAAVRAEVRAQESGDREQETGDRSQESVEPSRPPVEDCSRFGAPAPCELSAPADDHVANHAADEVCEEIENRRRAFLAALADEAAPVQMPRCDGNGRLANEPADDEATDLASVLPLSAATVERSQQTAVLSRPLSRKERRARQRLLERKLRRKVK